MPKLTTISSTPDCSSSSPTCWEARNVLRRFGPSVLLRACCCSVCFVASGPEICGLRSNSCGRAFRPTTSTFFRGISSSVCRHDLPAQFGSSRGSSPITEMASRLAYMALRYTLLLLVTSSELRHLKGCSQKQSFLANKGRRNRAEVSCGCQDPREGRGGVGIQSTRPVSLR